MIVARRCRVSGRVQGVFFRASTQREARQRDLRGYARNLPDGSVEVLAIGEPRQVAALEAWLWQGPPAAEVVDVRCTEAELQDLPDFITA